MKNDRYVAVAVAGFLALVSTARADAPPLTTPPDDDPHIRYDPDGVPLMVTEKQPARATPAQIAEARKERAQAALDKDWLLRAYEKQLQTHPETSSALYQNANPYQEISANKDLAKLAGLTDFHADSSDDQSLFRTKDGPGHAAPVLRRDTSMTTLGSAPFGSSFLTPIITPLSAPDAAGLKNFYASLPEAGMAPFDGSTPAPAPRPRTSVVPDPTDNDIETPGMIAAKSNPLTDPADLTLDVLPGESIDHAKAHQDDPESMLQLPLPLDAARLHSVEATALNPPVAKPADPNQPVAKTPVQPPLPDDYHAPMPVSAMPVITPVRSPIANPYDILNR